MKRKLIATALGAAMLAAPALAQTGPGTMGPGMMGPGMMGEGWGMLGAVHMLLWWALIILGIVVLAKWAFGGGRRHAHGGDRALEILRERYARGEIDKDEFDKRKRDLGA